MGSSTSRSNVIQTENFWEGGFGDILKTSQFSDVTLTNLNSKEYKAHKILLTRKSKYFQSLISENVSRDIFTVDDPYDCLDSVLTFLYTGCVNIKPENSEKLLESAEFYGIGSLTDTIFRNIKECLKEPELIFQYLNTGEQTRKICEQYISTEFTKIYESGSFGRCSCKNLTPKVFYAILSKDDLGIKSETIAAKALLDYITFNSSNLFSDDLKTLFSAIRFPFLNSQTLVQLYSFREYLPPSWNYSNFLKLCSSENITPPTNLSLEIQPRHTCDRVRSPLRFVIHPSITTSMTAQMTQEGSVVTKIGGSWWMNALSEEPLNYGKHRIFFRLNNTGGQYVGVGLGNAAYANIEEFLGQRQNGWSLCSSAGHPWDGHIFNGILTNTGVPYAPPECLSVGVTIVMDVDLDSKTVEFSVNDRCFGVAWRNVVPPVHVVVSMFTMGSSVTVWRD